MQPVSQEPLGGWRWELAAERGAGGQGHSWQKGGGYGKCGLGETAGHCGPVGWASWKLLYNHLASLPGNRCLARQTRESWSLSPRITFQWEVQGSK